MSNIESFNLPDVGEGLVEAEIVSWKVKPGDTVAVNDVIVEIETAKSLVELPSPYAGVVAELLVPEGQTIEVGTPIISVNVGGAGQPAPVKDAGDALQAPARPDSGALPQDAPAKTEGDPLAGAVEATPPAAEPGPGSGSLVGSGPKADAVKRRPRRSSSPVPPVPSAASPDSAVESEITRDGTKGQQRGETVQAAVNRLLTRVLAKPPVRKAAKDLGIDLADITPTGRGGEVTKADLLSYQAQRDAELDQAETFWAPSKKPQNQRIERVKVKGVRKATAKAMVESAFSAPHVSIFVDVDASRTMEFVKRLKVSRDFEGIKISPLLILAKAVIWAAARNPSVNATWTDDEILIKHFMNLGIAAATPRGLMVPNIKDAQDLSLKELAIALNELATKARAGKTQPAEMQGGTLTITNVGALGIDTGTPIINPGEVAIVAFGTIKQKPWVLDGEVIPRWITTLGGSFDHRVVDGDLSARFMADVAAIMEEPALLLD
ncbi:dihydrolipoamide acetyltransferase family protein [Arthrobacter sp. VKM Ac-2550]|uniref:dihydrolipoamide acetyltransferase family protein n=1 Tax=Crystallibacter permensis TaxID=1938888 RepID=UPI0022276364|nr:dihydrolipoamide acetyltransferase family protein [Arthrobacter sp. VKM Ac-2550]MCW2133738.1 pyruvate dehydrogenase E2 component (dihydrolipoamide acetyltransferase) [Arthrobacter sp. VKM Ac-2550]